VLYSIQYMVFQIDLPGYPYCVVRKHKVITRMLSLPPFDPFLTNGRSTWANYEIPLGKAYTKKATWEVYAAKLPGRIAATMKTIPRSNDVA
jgi:hypothetical protein